MTSLTRSLISSRPSRRVASQRYSRQTAPAAAAGSTGHQQKTALITGANSGIGFIASRELARQGYRVAMACRDIEKAKEAKSRILQEIPEAKVEALYVDLKDLDTINNFTARALDFGGTIDVMLNNAGVMATPAMTTTQGFEFQLGVNHLGHFLLTQSLLPLLTKPERPSRIINVASSAHTFGHMDFEDLQQRSKYTPWGAYGQSKLANVLYTYELARRLPSGCKTTVNALHPGVVATNLGKYLIDDGKWYTKPLVKASQLFLKTPEQGAATSIYLATSPEVEGVSSKYFSDCKPKTSSDESYDKDVARRLWDVSSELVGL